MFNLNNSKTVCHFHDMKSVNIIKTVLKPYEKHVIFSPEQGFYHLSPELYNIQQEDYQERKYFDENLNLPQTNNFCLSVTVCAIYRTMIAKLELALERVSWPPSNI